MTGQKVAVVGAGIIGAASAFHLARGGARVTVFDAGRPAASAASFGWINASFYHDLHHYRLRAESLEAWRSLDLDVPIDWAGCLCWDLEGHDFDRTHAELTSQGYPSTVVDRAEIAALEPALKAPPERALRFASEGAADTLAVVGALLGVDGVRVLRGLAVQAIEPTRAGIRLSTQAGAWEFDQVVVAAGVQSDGLIGPLGVGIPLVPRPAVIVRTAPQPKALRHVLATPQGELRQLPDGRFLMPGAISHQADASDSLGDPVAAADAVVARMGGVLKAPPGDWESADVGWRPVPEDGLPIVGEVTPGVHVAVMHSGVTLAALVGELMATEVLQGPNNRSIDLLTPYRPGRFVA